MCQDFFAVVVLFVFSQLCKPWAWPMPGLSHIDDLALREVVLPGPPSRCQLHFLAPLRKTYTGLWALTLFLCFSSFPLLYILNIIASLLKTQTYNWSPMDYEHSPFSLFFFFPLLSLLDFLAPLRKSTTDPHTGLWALSLFFLCLYFSTCIHFQFLSAPARNHRLDPPGVK